MTASGATTDRALATHLDDVASVSLEELGARAERLTRVDRKYLVPAADLPALLAELPARTRVLGIDGQRRFRYDTVYFDTPQLRSYRDAARGRPLRWKVRAGDAVALDGIAVVETKTGGRPSPVDRALWAFGHRPHPMSKYGTGMAAIRSDLPANRWHRTLAIAPFRPDRTF